VRLAARAYHCLGSWCLTLIFTVIWITVSPAVIAADEKAGSTTTRSANAPADVIPLDAYYVAAECRRLKSIYTPQYNQMLPHSARISNACHQSDSNELTPEAWLAKVGSDVAAVDRHSIPLGALGGVYGFGKLFARGYGAYALFLVPPLMTAQAHPELEKTFDVFSRVIGNNSVAIWLSRAPNGAIDPDWNSHYCRQFNLSCDTAPAIVATARPPADVRQGEKIVILDFAKVPSGEQQTALNMLINQMSAQRLDQHPFDNMVLLRNACRVGRAAVSGVSVGVDVKVVRFDISGKDMLEEAKC
jgi:hypothetical protein